MSSKINRWLEDEIEIIKEYYPKYGPTYCSKLLKRTIRACQEVAKRLDIKYKKNQKYEDRIKLEELIKECKTYTECVVKLGLSPRCSGNFQTIKKYIKIYNIDISHFSNGFQVNNLLGNKISLSEVLVKDSYYSRNQLKSRLFKEKIKIKICEICGQNEDWYGTKIVHILDHINGDPYDNRINNLRILCPNCNSTLDTNCAKNGNKKIYDSKNNEYLSAKRYKKCNCGELILKNSILCITCNGVKNRKINRPNIEELIKLQITKTNIEIGNIYGVSESSIRKWIKQYKNKKI